MVHKSLVYNVTLAEHCASIAFLSMTLRDAGADLCSIPALAAECLTNQIIRCKSAVIV